MIRYNLKRLKSPTVEAIFFLPRFNVYVHRVDVLGWWTAPLTIYSEFLACWELPVHAKRIYGPRWVNATNLERSIKNKRLGSTVWDAQNIDFNSVFLIKMIPKIDL